MVWRLVISASPGDARSEQSVNGLPQLQVVHCCVVLFTQPITHQTYIADQSWWWSFGVLRESGALSCLNAESGRSIRRCAEPLLPTDSLRTVVIRLFSGSWPSRPYLHACLWARKISFQHHLVPLVGRSGMTFKSEVTLLVHVQRASQ